MCGRFVNIEKKEKIVKLFPSSKLLNYSNKSYNISPSNLINVIYKNNNNIYIDNLFWSFSYFNKQNNITQFVINARIETIVSKYLFKESFIKRKCLIISNGYFEWTVEKVEQDGEFKDCWMTVGVSRPMPLSQAS